MTAMCTPENRRSCIPTSSSGTVWATLRRLRGARADSGAGDRLGPHGSNLSTSIRSRSSMAFLSYVMPMANWALYLFLCLLLCLLLASAAIRPAAPPGQDVSMIGRSDAAPVFLRDLALEAGARTALLSQCGIDGAPIAFAFEHRLEASGISQAVRRNLWQSYGASRSSAAAVLARTEMTECGGAYGLLKETIHDLNLPASQVDPADPTDSAELDPG
jgi:hypothetical protein